MTTLLNYMESAEGASAPAGDASQQMAAQLAHLTRFPVYSSSITASRRSVFFLGRQGEEKFLGILCSNSKLGESFDGQAESVIVNGARCTLIVCRLNSANAEAARKALPFLDARLLGLRKSVGCGDRLGLATPGHIRAVRQSTMAPIFAQQSMRENARTGRTPQQVMDDAMWGVLQEGWHDGFGADADHLKTPADIDLCVSAGYTFYTFDPGEHVDNAANAASQDALERMAGALPWRELETNLNELLYRLADKPIDLGSFSITVSPEELLRAVAKYGRAVAHTARMYRHLERTTQSGSFEVEMSVDETETVTTLAEHVYIAHELRRLGVKWVSLAPRYYGTFEKGVDYIGNLDEFERSFAQHAAVAQAFGPYKLSLHSGSDKFSVYSIAAKVAGELVHLKTAGTSYLEALRAIAALNPALFREIVAFGSERYTTDKATYHVSAEVAKMPDIRSWPDGRLPALLDDFHGREILHVTFGSVLNHVPFRGVFFATLRDNESVYDGMLEEHFKKHLAPFANDQP
ncbi:MAG TPA: tagaturonate epimerase family protein [Acidobacteriota bacterium]|nr:tagaturonate epimerase family protein [Acidobacteriota bacterium]